MVAMAQARQNPSTTSTDSTRSRTAVGTKRNATPSLLKLVKQPALDSEQGRIGGPSEDLQEGDDGTQAESLKEESTFPPVPPLPKEIMTNSEMPVPAKNSLPNRLMSVMKAASVAAMSWCSPRKRPASAQETGDVLLEEEPKIHLPPSAKVKVSKKLKHDNLLALARNARWNKGAVNELEAGFSASSSKKSKKAIRRTIEALLKEASKEALVPATPDSIKLLAGVLKKANYRAAHLYIAEYKLIHIEAGYAWTDLLDRVSQQCKRSALRGIGPGSRAYEVITNEVGRDFVKAAKVKVSKSFVPLARQLFEFGIIWMLRRAELCKVELDHIFLDLTGKKVTLKLPDSKTDQRAQGAFRVLQCLCAKKTCVVSCPFYVSMRLVDALNEKNWRGACRLSDSKLATKGQLEHSWKKLFGTKVTGHTPRRTGALRYIRHGWTIAQVAYLGRWKSSVIYGYAEEALESMAVNAHKSFNNVNTHSQDPESLLAANPHASTDWQAIKDQLTLEVEAMKVNQNKAHEALDKEVEAWKARAEGSNGLLPPYVQTTVSKVVHANMRVASCSPPPFWQTLCGWRYHLSGFVFASGSEIQVNCAKCLHLARSNEV